MSLMLNVLTSIIDTFTRIFNNAGTLIDFAFAVLILIIVLVIIKIATFIVKLFK